MHETNGTRPDEQFPAGPYLGRWESSYKYTSKYTFMRKGKEPDLEPDPDPYL